MSRRDLSPEAIKVLYRLHRSGYQAFLVGGSVRDLLLGRRPKDFDVATNARPQEIRRLFRNSRIIGRRFRLVHVFFRGEIVEVATFRASPEPPETPDDWEEAVEEAAEEAAEEEVADAPPLRQEEDVYGTPAEDARRRDFTVNAIFYNIADFSIIDHVGGIDDLEARVIRTIGDPDQRFEEDPVRMMRALEYAARLDFEVEERTTDAIKRQQALIAEASAPRLTYELLESLRSGVAAGIFKAWEKAGLFGNAFPDLPNERERTGRVLGTVDSGVASGRYYCDASLLGGLYLPCFFELVKACTTDNGRVSNGELLAGLHDLMAPAGASMRLSNQTLHLMQQGLFTLTKMRQAPERGRQVVKLARQEYFRVAWDLHGFAVALGLVSKEAHSGWKNALDRVGKENQPEQSVNAAEHPSPRPRRRPRRRRRRH